MLMNTEAMTAAEKLKLPNSDYNSQPLLPFTHLIRKLHLEEYGDRSNLGLYLIQSVSKEGNNISGRVPVNKILLQNIGNASIELKRDKDYLKSKSLTERYILPMVWLRKWAMTTLWWRGIV